MGVGGHAMGVGGRVARQCGAALNGSKGLAEPMGGWRGAIGRDRGPAGFAVKADGLGEVFVGVELQGYVAEGAGLSLDVAHQAAGEALTPGGRSDPEAFDLGHGDGERAEGDAADWRLVEQGDQEGAMGRAVGLGFRVGEGEQAEEQVRDARCEQGEVLSQAIQRLWVVGVGGADLGLVLHGVQIRQIVAGGKRPQCSFSPLAQAPTGEGVGVVLRVRR